MAAAKTLRRPDDLAVLAAMDLLTDSGWVMTDIAAALKRDEAWLQTEIDKALEADARSAGALH